MKGSDDVITILNDVLSAELTGINQYFIHAKMADNWGYYKLAAHSRQESLEEMQQLNENIVGLAVLQQSNALLSQLTSSSALIGQGVKYVDPDSGARDMAIPASLLRTYHHQNMGLYARVEGDGEIAVGDRLTIPR